MPLSNLPDRAAVVIGGGSGIGRGISLGLAREGMRVLVADIDLDSANSVQAELMARGAAASASHVDSTDRHSLTALSDRAVAEFGAVHLLVNTVGAIIDRPLAEATESDWQWMLEANVMTQVRGVDAFLPALRSARPSHIVTTASMGGMLASPPEQSRGFHLGLYTTAKHALLGYSEMLRMELAAGGIGVSVLCPTRVTGKLQETSLRHRPERFGGPATAPPQGEMPGLVPNEAVGPIVVQGVKENRFCLLTHPEMASVVEDRFRKILDRTPPSQHAY